MKKTILAISIFTALLVGCNDSDDTTHEPPPSTVATPLEFGTTADKVQINSLKYPNSTPHAVNIINGQLSNTPDLLGQNDDLFLLNYLAADKNIGFILATKQQILEQKVELNEFSFLISHEAMEKFLALSYADMLIFKDRLADQLLKSDLDGNQIINYEDILSLNNGTNTRQNLEFDYQQYLSNQNNSLNINLSDAHKTGDVALFSSVMNEVFDPLTTLEDPTMFTKTVFKTEIEAGEHGEITTNNNLLEPLNKTNSTAVLLNNPIETSPNTRTANTGSIVLTATPTTANMVFEGWEGCENSNANTCTVDLNQNNKVYAHFGSVNTLEIPKWNTQTCEQAQAQSANNELPTACLSLNSYISPTDSVLNQGRVVFAFGTDGCYASAPVYTALDGSLKANPGTALGGSKTSKCNYFNQMNNAYLTYREVSSNKSNYKARIFGLYAVKDQCSAVLDTINYIPNNICGHINEWEHVIIWMKDDKPEYVSHTKHNWIETKKASEATHLENQPNTFVFKYIQEAGQSSHFPSYAGSKDGIYAPSQSPTPEGTLFGADARQILDYKNAPDAFKKLLEKEEKGTIIANQSWERVTQRVYDNNWLNSKVCPVRITSSCEKHWIIPAIIDKISVMPQSWANANVKF